MYILFTCSAWVLSGVASGGRVITSITCRGTPPEGEGGGERGGRGGGGRGVEGGEDGEEG